MKPVKPEKIQKALNTLKQALAEDGTEPGSLSYSWFCLIKDATYDVLGAYEPDRVDYYSGQISDVDQNQLAAIIANTLMQLLFQITTDYE